MSNSNLSRNDRLNARRFRAPIAVSGAALLGLSLLLSVGPALAANNNSNGNGGNNGNAASTNGTLKVHNAATGAESGGNGNEPHVCDFWLSFVLDAPFEAGTWTLVSWAPTGDGSTVASGLYDTSGDGVDSSSVIDLPGGHYRVEWAALGATVSNKKTIWVDADCDAPVTPVDESQAEDVPPTEDASPVDDTSPPEDASPAEFASPTEDASPVDDTSPPEDASPAEESLVTNEDSPTEDSSPTEDGSPAEESLVTSEDSPTEDGSPAEESLVTDEEAPASDSQSSGDESVLGSEGSSAEDPGLPAEEPADESPITPGDPSDEEEAAQAVDPGAADASSPPTQNQLGGTGTADEPTMADTATPSLPVSSGLAATLGVLMLIVAHATIRRGKRSPSRA